MPFGNSQRSVRDVSRKGRGLCACVCWTLRRRLRRRGMLMASKTYWSVLQRWSVLSGVSILLEGAAVAAVSDVVCRQGGACPFGHLFATGSPGSVQFFTRGDGGGLLLGILGMVNKWRLACLDRRAINSACQMTAGEWPSCSMSHEGSEEPMRMLAPIEGDQLSDFGKQHHARGKAPAIQWDADRHRDFGESSHQELDWKEQRRSVSDKACQTNLDQAAQSLAAKFLHSRPRSCSACNKQFNCVEASRS